MREEAERRFWRDAWESVPTDVAREHGIERRDFGPVQATIVASLPKSRMLNLVLGATELGAIADGHLAQTLEWAGSRGVGACVPVAPGAPEADAAEDWLRANGYEPGYAWMKFTRDAHPPRFRAPDVEVAELTGAEDDPFGMIAATGFGLPHWASALFAHLPGRAGWHCYVARVDGVAQACAAMLVHEEVAEFGIAATLEPARGLGCQQALLHRRVVDAAAAGCHSLTVETGERIPGHPSPSYRNILRAGFEEAYLRPNWEQVP